MSDTGILFFFADYLCSDLVQQQDLSLSSKENEDPAVKPSKPPTTAPAPLQKLPDNKKETKNTNHLDDFFEDDDDVFQQYMPQDACMDGDNKKPVQQLQLTGDRGHLKGTIV